MMALFDGLLDQYHLFSWACLQGLAFSGCISSPWYSPLLLEPVS